MKIPETSANIGAYYGNEENGQWQGNGVMLDSGVGGGVVGSGDAGFLHPHPHYPIRPHLPQPGYMVAGAYYAPPNGGYGPVPQLQPQDDFADYMWMENEEEFDKQVMQQLEEEALMEQCIEAMLEDERERERNNRPVPNGHAHYPTTSNGLNIASLEEQVSKSTLNPLAAEFVPTFARSSTSSSDITLTPTDTSGVLEEKPPNEPMTDKLNATTELTTEAPPSTNEDVRGDEPPEVSAADVHPVKREEEKPTEKRPKELKDLKKPIRAESKKPVKPEPKAKVKPQVVRSETKVPPKKRELLKPVKSEDKFQGAEIIVPIVETVKSQPLPVEEPSMPTMKPINYAAAAKANKVKKTTPPPALEKPLPSCKPLEKPTLTQKSDRAVKSEKPIHRKNSTK